uniref:PIR Superfamily Protein n=1 Tax=Rhabditophanes sp. KR3021 TaxID=114890 RepID=A0AC35TTQ1_9BILA
MTDVEDGSSQFHLETLDKRVLKQRNEVSTLSQEEGSIEEMEVSGGLLKITDNLKENQGYAANLFVSTIVVIMIGIGIIFCLFVNFRYTRERKVKASSDKTQTTTPANTIFLKGSDGWSDEKNKQILNTVLSSIDNGKNSGELNSLLGSNKQFTTTAESFTKDKSQCGNVEKMRELTSIAHEIAEMGNEYSLLCSETLMNTRTSEYAKLCSERLVNSLTKIQIKSSGKKSQFKSPKERSKLLAKIGVALAYYKIGTDIREYPLRTALLQSQLGSATDALLDSIDEENALVSLPESSTICETITPFSCRKMYGNTHKVPPVKSNLLTTLGYFGPGTNQLSTSLSTAALYQESLNTCLFKEDDDMTLPNSVHLSDLESAGPLTCHGDSESTY